MLTSLLFNNRPSGMPARTNISKFPIYVLWIVFMTCIGCAKGKDSYGTYLTGYNHTESGIASYSVKIGNSKFAGAGFLGAGSGGGAMTCCIEVPSTWRNNLIATVKFTSSDGTDKEVSRDVLIPKYTDEDAGHVGVHFLANGKVKVFVSQYSLGHGKYPLSGKEAELKPGVPMEITWD